MRAGATLSLLASVPDAPGDRSPKIRRSRTPLHPRTGGALMMSFASARPWVANALNRLSEASPKRAARDVTACYCQEHPGTIPLGRVLYHTSAFDGVRAAELMECCDALVLLDQNGAELAHIERARLRTVECASASAGGCRERNPLQSEEHLFIGYDDEQGRRVEVEISFGALDDVGPVRKMCDHLRSLLTPAT
jgi:hypothetical protein